MKARKVLRHVSFLLALAALVALPFLVAAAPAQDSTTAQPPFAPGRILVKFRPEIKAADRAAFHQAEGGQSIEVIPGIGVEVVNVPVGTEEVKAAAYARSPLVAYAELDYVASALESPHDPEFAKQWGLNNEGQTGGKLDADIDAPEAWAVTTGSNSVLIAILDTGIDQDHEDLASKVVTSTNFTNSSTVDDLYGHGTHVAGIAAAVTNNETGVAGVCWGCGLLNVKVLNDQGSGYYSWVAWGIVWATHNGAKVINMSLGANIKSRTLENVVNYAWSKGVVLACAGGNNGNTIPTYPAAYRNCIAVAATNAKDRKAFWSSYGSRWMDVAAPGVGILSTLPNDFYGFGSGTSMATPHVAGVAGLVWSTPGLCTDNACVRNRIESTADRITGTGIYWIYGRINACNAVGGNCSYGNAQP